MTRRIPYILAFLAGFAILVVELCGGRFINRHLGSSLYGWTALIGVILGGVSLGNLFGGMLVGTNRARRVLAEACLLASLLTILVLRLHPLLSLAVVGMEGIPWGTRVVLIVTGVLFVPAVGYGLISPLATDWALRTNPERQGAVLGSMAACGTWGAIIGTFLTGFYLIGALGTASLLITTACILGLMGLWLLGAHTLRAGWLAFPLVVFAMVYTWPLPGRAATVHDLNRQLAQQYTDDPLVYFDESNYFTIQVVKARTDDGKRRLDLVLDQLIHGFVVLDEPTRLEYGYEHVYSWVTRRLAKTEGLSTLRCLYLGGGAYTFPRWVEHEFPGSQQLVAEIDPRVTEAVHAAMYLPRDTPIRTQIDDARHVVHTEPPGSYDVIYGDAFNGFSVPYHLTTLEFDQAVDRLLAPNGVYLLNLIDIYDPVAPEKSRFVGSVVRTLAQVFGDNNVSAYVAESFQIFKPGVSSRTTFVVVCHKGPLDLTRLGMPEVDLPPTPGQALQQIIPLEGPARTLLASRGLTLTDDYVPVDQLLAPVAATRADEQGGRGKAPPGER